VHYVHRALDLEDLVALYVAADVMLVTPLCDGMNLVAKEFVVSSRKPGMLVLSEFAGAVDEFGSHCLTVNPWDPEGLTAAMVTALEMKPEDRRARMQAMRDQVRSHDVHRWAEDFLANLQGRRAVRRARTSRRCVVPYVDPTSEPVLAKG